MKLSTPRWWYVRRGAPMGLTRMLLRPLSWLWAWETARRIDRATPVDPGIAVICVGNLTVGGTGKTPVVRALAARLRAQGLNAQVLSRGYGGALKGPAQVDPKIYTAAEVGDEPLMLARDMPVWISRDRPSGAGAMAAAGAEAIVMDDGHQNPSLKKTLSLVVVDGETRAEEWPFGDGAVFPSGPMREPFKLGLARADAVILLLPADLDEADPLLLAVFGDKPVLIARLAPTVPPPAGPQFAFAGIGKPWKMERALVAAGCELADFAPLPDHVRYDAGLLKDIADRARALGAGLLTSEKDWVRLPPDWRARVTPWSVEARFDDEAALDRVLGAVRP